MKNWTDKLVYIYWISFNENGPFSVFISFSVYGSSVEDNLSYRLSQEECC